MLRRVMREHPAQKYDSKEDAVNSEGRESSTPDPIHEPGDHAQGHDERNDKTDDQNGPFMTI